MRLRLLSSRYNVERLGGFEGVPSALTTTPTLASSEYSIFRVARAFRYMIFFARSDSIGSQPERGASCVVARVLLNRRVVRIQLGKRLNSSTNSCTETLAPALEMIYCRCIGVKLGPLGVFPEISVPN